MHPNVRKFLGTHTKKNVGGVSSTVRDSKTAPYHWKKDLEFAQIKDVQSKCQEAMSLWGYRAYDYEGDVQSINSVDKLKWD
jgi:intein-encoded DNA endonuclease-like protein